MAIFKIAWNNRKFQIYASFIGHIGIVCSWMQWGITSPYLQLLLSGDYYFQITTEESSWIILAPLAAGLLGSTLIPFLEKNISRKSLFLLSSLSYATSWWLIGFAKSLLPLLVGRGLAGFTDGVYFVLVPMYIGEISSSDTKGLLSSIWPFTILVGLFLMNVLGSYLSINTVSFIAMFLPTALLITSLWMLESPFYLLKNGDVDDAKEALRLFNGTENIDQIVNRLTSLIKIQGNKMSLKDLFCTDRSKRAFICMTSLRSIQQLIGLMVINIYCHTIFSESKGFMKTSKAVIVFSVIQLFMCAVSSSAVDLIGRKSLLIVSMASSSVCLLIIATYFYMTNSVEETMPIFQVIPAVALFLYAMGSSVGIHPVPYVMLGEVIPFNVKFEALALVQMYLYGLSATTCYLFHYSMTRLGLHVPFFVFATVCLLGLFIIIFVVPESRERYLDETETSNNPNQYMQVEKVEKEDDGTTSIRL